MNETRVAADTPRIGPPPVMPLMCFPCVTGTCKHRDRLASTHGGGLMPALTIHRGTALCLDCADEEAGR
jgi:hypothetical protein